MKLADKGMASDGAQLSYHQLLGHGMGKSPLQTVQTQQWQQYGMIITYKPVIDASCRKLIIKETRALQCLLAHRSLAYVTIMITIEGKMKTTYK